MARQGLARAPELRNSNLPMTTRLCSSSDMTRAISLMTVVLPTPSTVREALSDAMQHQKADMRYQSCLGIPGLPMNRSELGTVGNLLSAIALLIAKARTGSARRNISRRTCQDISYHVNMTSDCTAHAARQPHDCALAIADGRYAVQGPRHACPVVTPEIPHSSLCRLQVYPGDLCNLEGKVRGQDIKEADNQGMGVDDTSTRTPLAIIAEAT